VGITLGASYIKMPSVWIQHSTAYPRESDNGQQEAAEDVILIDMKCKSDPPTAHPPPKKLFTKRQMKLTLQFTNHNTQKEQRQLKWILTSRTILRSQTYYHHTQYYMIKNDNSKWILPRSSAFFSFSFISSWVRASGARTGSGANGGGFGRGCGREALSLLKASKSSVDCS